MHFLADESRDFAFVRALRAAGHEVETVTETYGGAPDEVVTRISAHARHILLTEDKDLGQLVYAGSGLSVGVILILFVLDSVNGVPAVYQDGGSAFYIILGTGVPTDEMGRSDNWGRIRPKRIE